MRSNKNAGFTLAELLITLSIIGIVAALTIPQLVKNMNDYAFGKSKDVTLAKITEATSQMKSNDVLSGYTTNDAFVNEFQKYMKVIKTCDSSTLANCFPAKFKAGTDDIDTTTLTAGTKLGANNISGNTIALMLANGTSILFTLRDSTKVSGACDRIDPTDNQTNTTGCMSFLYDINGFGSPNVIGKDIGTVNATISTCDGTKFGALCFAAADTAYSPINTCSGGTAADKLYDPTGDSNSACANNVWAGAIKACVSIGMRLPTKSELTTMYVNRATISGLAPASFYWSSEEMASNMSWGQNSNDGSQAVAMKNHIGWPNNRCVK